MKGLVSKKMWVSMRGWAIEMRDPPGLVGYWEMGGPPKWAGH